MVEVIALWTLVVFMLAAVLGLFTIAGCYFIGLSRLTIVGGIASVLLGSEAFPAFAQAMFPEPREITGKIVCSNCHLANRDTLFSAPAI